MLFMPGDYECTINTESPKCMPMSYIIPENKVVASGFSLSGVVKY